MKKRSLWKRMVAAGLGLAVALSMAGCSQAATQADDEGSVSGESVSDEAASGESAMQGAEGQASSEGEEPVEISIAIWNADEAFAGDDVTRMIEEKLNIRFKPMNVTWDDYYQKIQLWASSGSLPDLFIGDFRNTISYPQWADQGVIKEIPSNLDAYPQLKEYLSGQAAKDAMLNGKLYCIPRQGAPSQEWTVNDRLISYRWDLAQKAGIEKEPETWEEFQEMILAIIEADTEETGIGGVTSADKNLLSGLIMPYASPIIAEGGSGFKWVKDEDGIYKPAYFVEDTVKALQLARDMYQSGVIEKDIVLTSNQSAEEKFLQGKSAAIVMSGGFGNKYDTISRYWKDVHGTEYLDDVKELAVMPGADGKKTYPMWGYAWSESYINAKISDEKLDKILQLYDYLLTDEGAFLSCYGPEGELYDLVDGKVVLKNPDVPVKDTYPSTDALGVLVRWNPSNYDDRFVTSTPAEYGEVDRKRVEEVAGLEMPEYNQRCTQLVMELELEFAIHFNDDFLNVMTGEEPVEQMWEELCEQYKEDGLDEAIEKVNSALAAE